MPAIHELKRSFIRSFVIAIGRTTDPPRCILILMRLSVKLILKKLKLPFGQSSWANSIINVEVITYQLKPYPELNFHQTIV